VLEILKNRKYAGTYVWGTTSQRLSSRTLRTPPQEWIRCSGAIQPIIEMDTFERVQQRLSTSCLYTDDDMLSALKRLLAERGRLSESTILNCRYTPCSTQYARRFGSLNAAYRLIGYEPGTSTLSTVEQRARAIKLRNAVIQRLVRVCPTVVSFEKKDEKRRPHLIVDGNIRVTVLICLSTTTVNGHLRWGCCPVRKETSNVTLVCPLDAANRRIRSAYVLAPGIFRLTVSTLKQFSQWGFHLKSGLAFARQVRQANHFVIDPNTRELKRNCSVITNRTNNQTVEHEHPSVFAKAV